MATIMKVAELENAVRALTSAQETDLGIEVSIPVAYGDGELTSVVVEQVEDGFSVHDAGFSAMRLTSVGVSFSRHVVHRLNELAQRYRCAFSDGRVIATSDIKDDLAQAVCLVANAARSVADYAYEIRRQAEHDFRLIVVEKLREIVGSRAREPDEFRGKSGRRYRLPFILDTTETHPQNFLATLAHRQVVPQSFAMLYDLGEQYPLIKRDAIYDDGADIRDEDRKLLKSSGAKVFSLMETPLRFRELAGHG